jgi:hypothetical protein
MSCMVLVINSTILSRLFIYITLYVHGPVVETWSPGHVLRVQVIHVMGLPLGGP